MVTRIGAVLAGLIVLGFILVMSLGGAAFTLVVLAVAAAIWRRRGHRLGPIEGLLTAVIASTVMVVVAFGIVTARHPGTLESVRAGMVASQRAPQPPPPAFLRELPGGNVPPPKLPDSWAGPLTVAVLIMAGALMGGIVGALAWGGAWLVVYGVRGPRAPIAKIALPAE
jgi:hypothetical protein